MTDKHEESQLPEGDFTWSTGSNHGMDGFYHDTRYDEGTAEGDRVIDHIQIQHPQTGGYSHLPDGVVTSSGRYGSDIEAPDGINRHEDAFDLTAFFDEGGLPGGDDLTGYFDPTAGIDDIVANIIKEGTLSPGELSDLDWLDPTQGPDAARLPYGNLDAVEQLNAVWMANEPQRVATGIHAIPAVDREAASYFRSLDEGYEPRPENPIETKLAHDRVKNVVLHAMRRSTYGEPMSVIAVDALALLGPLAGLAKRALAKVEDEHGLAGNVYIRASAFPGLENGKWTAKLAKRASGARYILAAAGTTLARHKVFMGRQVVQEIPWERAYAHYAPRLKSAGHTVECQGDPRDLLKLAFLNGPQELLRRTAEGQPVWSAPADQISSEAARTALGKAPKQAREVLSPKGAVAAQQRREALLRIAHWVKGHVLSQEDAQRLASTDAPPHVLLDTAAKLILATTRSGYQGIGEGQLPRESEMSREAAWADLARSVDPRVAQQVEVEAAMRRTLELNVQKWIDNGQVTQKEAHTLLTLDKPAVELMKLATALIHQTDRFRKHEIPQAKQASPYGGAVFTEKPVGVDTTPKWSQGDLRVIAAARSARVKPGEISTMLRWARIQMNEGTIGKELDSLLRARFATPVLAAAEPFIEEVRNAHEGLSGHLYVDVEAYASATDVRGCEAGAQIHRRNGLKFALAMDRCGACAFNKGGSCQKYKKALVEAPPVEDATAYQVEAIRMANASDYEVTSSLFSQNTYQPEEYGLGNNAMDDINLNASMEVEALGSVLWGRGMNIDF